MIYKVIISDINGNEGYLSRGRLSKRGTIYTSPSAARKALSRYIETRPYFFARVEKAGPIDAS